MPGSDASRAYIWSESRGIQNLGSLGGRHSAANSINNRREVVGFAELANGRFHAFLWAPGHRMRDLGTLGGNNSTATDINDQSVVAGVADLANGSSHAFRWTAARGMEDLGTFTHVPTDPSQANGISQTGLITGFARTARQGRGVPLDPSWWSPWARHAGRVLGRHWSQHPPAGGRLQQRASGSDVAISLDAGRRHRGPGDAGRRLRGGFIPERVRRHHRFHHEGKRRLARDALEDRTWRAGRVTNGVRATMRPPDPPIRGRPPAQPPAN